MAASRRFKRRHAGLPLTAVLLSLFVGVAPASGLSCVPPADSVAHAMKSPSETFFTGTARSIESVSQSRSDVTFDVELLWHGSDVPESEVVEKGEKAQSYPTFVVRFHTLRTGSDLVTGRRYHVVLSENKSSNPCGVFDADDLPHLTDGIDPIAAFGDFAHRTPGPLEPVRNDAERARWWAASIGAAVLLGVATLMAFLSARRRPGTRHPGLGALIGLDVGAALAGWVILLPSLRDGDFYEITDPLIILGLPLLIVGSAVGAIVGTVIRRGGADTTPRRAGRSVALVVISLVACLLGTLIWLWGTGVVNFP